MSNQDAFNRANVQGLSSLFQMIGLGDLLRGQIPQVRRALNPDVLGRDAGNLATLDTIVLPDSGRANSILRAYSRAAGAGTGALVIALPGVTPGSGEIAVANNGNIVVLAADAHTDIDVTYVPERGDVVETYLPVVANVITIPAGIAARHVVAVLDVEALDGTVQGRNIIVAPGGVPATTRWANLNVAKTSVQFVVADAVTRARVKFLVSASKDLNALLAAADFNAADLNTILDAPEAVV